jgi:hypothetical protein
MLTEPGEIRAIGFALIEAGDTIGAVRKIKCVHAVDADQQDGFNKTIVRLSALSAVGWAAANPSARAPSETHESRFRETRNFLAIGFSPSLAFIGLPPRHRSWLRADAGHIPDGM